MDGLLIILAIIGIVNTLIKKAKQQQAPASVRTSRSPEPEKPWQRMLGDITKTLEEEVTGKPAAKVYRPVPKAENLPSASPQKTALPGTLAEGETMIPANYVDTEGTSAPLEPLPKWHGSLAGTEGAAAATISFSQAAAAPEYAQASQKAFHVSMTKDSLLQAVVMHEILTRPQDRRRRWVRP